MQLWYVLIFATIPSCTSTHMVHWWWWPLWNEPYSLLPNLVDLQGPTESQGDPYEGPGDYHFLVVQLHCSTKDFTWPQLFEDWCMGGGGGRKITKPLPEWCLPKNLCSIPQPSQSLFYCTGKTLVFLSTLTLCILPEGEDRHAVIWGRIPLSRFTSAWERSETCSM